MDAKKSSPNKNSSKTNSPKNKESKKSNKTSPKDKKRNGSPKSDEQSEENKDFWQPRPETPPPKPAIGAGINYVRRQPWYPYINNPDFTYKEYSWNPFCPLITSWGHLWVSDPQNRKIWRYKLDPCLNNDLVKLPDIITRGEPYQLFEIPKIGRVLALTRCPTARKTTLTQFSPSGLEELVRNYPFETPNDNGDSSNVDSNNLQNCLDEGRPVGVTADNDLIYVLRNPIQRMELLQIHRLTPADFRLQYSTKSAPSCIHLATSGGCAVGNDLLYVAATRPARIVVFQIIKEFCYRIVDRITLRMLFEFGMDRLKQPYCLRLDSLCVLGVSDSQWGYLRAFHRAGIETSSFGGWKVDELRPVRPGHFSVSKNGIIVLVDHHKNCITIYIDRVMFRWYQDSLFYLEKVPWLRGFIDSEMPPVPPIKRPDPKDARFRIIWPDPDPDGIWPRPPKQIPLEEEPKEEKKSKQSPKKGSKKSKDSPSKSPKSPTKRKGKK